MGAVAVCFIDCSSLDFSRLHRVPPKRQDRNDRTPVENFRFQDKVVEIEVLRTRGGFEFGSISVHFVPHGHMVAWDIGRLFMRCPHCKNSRDLRRGVRTIPSSRMESQLKGD